jgi:hypothetical protein
MGRCAEARGKFGSDYGFSSSARFLPAASALITYFAEKAYDETLAIHRDLAAREGLRRDHCDPP